MLQTQRLSGQHAHTPQRTLGQLGYHADPERSAKSEVEGPTTRELYSSNSSAYITFQPTHVRSTIHTRAMLLHIDLCRTCANFSITPPLSESCSEIVKTKITYVSIDTLSSRPYNLFAYQPQKYNAGVT